MNGHTQNDLSFNHTTLDYQALLHTARVAYGHSLEQVYRYYSELRAIDCSNTKRYLTANYLATESKHLAVAADTLSTLLEGIDREELDIVNKPNKTAGH